VPVLPNLIERALYRAGIAPRPVLDIAAAASFRGLQAAFRLGLLERLASGPLTAAELAVALDVDETSLVRLLDLLEAAGHVRRRGDTFVNSAGTQRWLVRDGRASLADFVAIWTEVVFDEWDTLEDSIRTGRPARHMHEWLATRAKWPAFNAAMATFARSTADLVAAAIPLAASRNLIDIGGSHGLYAIACCLREPGLRATIFDLPEALEHTMTNAAAAGVADRVSVRSGDLTTDELGSGYDVALMFQLLHYFDDTRLAAVLAKVRAALAPGGRIVILDQLTTSGPLPGALAFIRTLALQYKTSLGGDLRSFAEVRRALETAGFSDARHTRLLRSPGNELAIARR
jgi:SAM-dependent methyltransferase